MLKGGCYVRVSTDNQLENYSIEEQTDRLRSFCQAKDIQIVNIYTDGGFSGGNTNRPALQQMLADIEAGIIEIVVVHKLDRLSRSQKDTLMLIEDKFMANHVDFISVNENFDTTTPFGRAMIGMLSVFAQLEKDQITERFTMGRIGRAKNGFYHGGSTAPTGYDYVDGRLVVNEYEALQVQDLFERFSKGYPLHNCWRYMQEKYVTKYGAWKSEALVRNVLKNNIYIGMVKFKGKSYKGIHEPIISTELYQTVQDILTRPRPNMPSCKRCPFKAGTLLSGLIYCGKCGARCHGEHGNYSCYSRSKGDKKYILDPDCKNKKWKINELDALVIEYISQLCFEEPAPGKKTLVKKDYSGRILEIEKQLLSLIDLYQVGGISHEVISNKIQLLAKEKNALLEKMQEAKELPVEAKDCPFFKDKFLALIEKGNLPERRTCLASIVDKIVINDEHIDIHLK